MGKKKDSLGDRMKRHEAAGDHLLPRRLPIIVRADGQAFHTYTKGFNRPFDARIIESMQYAATKTAESMCGFKLCFIQSDEASFLLTDYDDIATQAWFDNSLNKLVSITASWMTVHFNRHILTMLGNSTADRKLAQKVATFDARAFVLPQSDVSNYFLWRAKDWERNSLSMYARQFFSNKQLHGKNRSNQHEMLHFIGKNWAKDLSDQQRNGTWLYRTNGDGGVQQAYAVVPSFASVDAMLKRVLPVEGLA